MLRAPCSALCSALLRQLRGADRFPSAVPLPHVRSGFYDDDLEFIGLERIQIVASMNPSTLVGRHPLSTRFTAIVRVVVVDSPPREQLEQAGRLPHPMP